MNSSFFLRVALLVLLVSALVLLPDDKFTVNANAQPYVGFFSPERAWTSAGNANLNLRQPDPRAGDLLIAVLAIRPGSNTINTPSGWTLLGSWTGTDGAGEGIDAGSVSIYWFYKLATGSEGTANQTFTENGTTSVWMGTIMQIRSATQTYDISAGGYSINGDTTNWGGTLDTDIGLTAGDLVLIGAAQNGDLSNSSAQNITATGVSTKSTVYEHGEFTSTTGNDIEIDLASTLIWTGTNTATPTLAQTMSAAASGAMTAVRIRQGSGTNRGDTWVRSAGAQVAGSTSVAVPYPEHSVGDLLVLFIGNRYDTATPSTPSGWTLLANSYTGGVGTNGVDAGTARASAYYRQVTSLLSGTQSVTVTSGNTSIGQMVAIHRDDVKTWVTDVDGGGDSTAGTAWSVTGSGIDLDSAYGGDVVVTGTSVNTDAYLYSGHGMSASGITFGDVTQTAEFRSTTGSDMTLELATGRISSGSGSPAITFTSTASGSTANAPAGATIFVKAVGIAPALTQSAYRFFANANSTDVGSALASQDTAASLSSDGDAFRLRMLIHVADAQLDTSAQNFKLQFAEKSGTCDTSFTGESYEDVTGATAIAFNNNATPSDGAALTANGSDPTHSGHTIVNQTYEEANNFTTSQAAVASGQDGKWDFALVDNSASGDYCFRIVRSDDSLLDTYSVIPEVTAAGAGNALPTASSVSIDSGSVTATLTENTTKNIICEGTVTDTDGYTDISHVGAFLYRTTVGTTTASDENNLYRLYGDSECIPSGGAGNSETYTCTFPVWYYADPTDAGSPYEADNWTCEPHPADSIATGTPATDTIEMGSLQALNVTSSIAYGTVNPNTDTGATNQQVTITNTGNVEIDPELSGTAMTDGGSGSISASQQKYDDASFTYSSGGTALSGTPTTLNLTLPQRTSTEITDLVYWGLGVPNGTPDGGYTGSNTFTATTPESPSVLAFVQDTEAFQSGSAPATTAAFPSNTASGNLIVVAASWDGCGNAEITDNKSNSYAAATVKQQGPGAIICSQIFYAENITGGASHTITISATSGTVEFIKLVAHEVSGAATSGALDQNASGTSSGASQSVGPVTTTTDGQYIFATASEESQSNNNFSASGSFTERETADDAGSWQTQTQDYVQPSAGSISATWTASSGSSQSTVQMATFK